VVVQVQGGVLRNAKRREMIFRYEQRYFSTVYKSRGTAVKEWEVMERNGSESAEKGDPRTFIEVNWSLYAWKVHLPPRIPLWLSAWFCFSSFVGRGIQAPSEEPPSV
jgi:hypothetical protein